MKRRESSRAAFTLIELLLVVVIALIATGLAIPRFVRSYEGAKLRGSMRTIVMANRYARAMSVLRQTQTAILFDVAKQEIEVVSVGSSGNRARNAFMDVRADRTGLEDDDEEPGERRPSYQVTSEMIRPLADGVTIEQVDIGDAPQDYDGIYWINYYPNGMCDRFEILLSDDRNQRASLAINPLTGKSRVEYE